MTPHSFYFPGDPVDWPAVRQALQGLEIDDSDAARERAAADYHWYSPILAEALQGKRPDLVVKPHNQDEVLLLAAVCARHRVPLTVRGGGTGNYGQCVPLHGGIVMDATALNRILRLEPGWAVVEAGVLIHDLNQAARATGQQLRMWPSTERIATLGGFIAGGHSGIGSIRHGILADPGNVRRLRIVTLEDPPQVIDLHDADIQKAHHAYGTNGLITEVEIALTDAVDWQHTITLFDSYDAVLRFGLAVGQRSRDGSIDVFQLSAVERRITPYYAGLRDRLEDADAMFAQVSPGTLPAYEALAAQMGGRVVVRGTEAELLAEGLPSATECAYNHTTLEALKSDRGVTYLQVAYPGPLDPALVAAQMQRFGDELYFHHEFSRAGGELVAFALPLVQYFDAAQQRELIASFEADGCRIFDPHTFRLEDGGMKQVDEAQLAFKQRADPLGLMNPGKVRAWDERMLGLQVGA
ncbi:MAG: FAD-binding oxidoreductase [Burkholderiales bacterium]|nr:FAD-binding oxidoreductase [Burkholderiales bacterium]